MANSIILWTFLGLIITFVAKYLMDAGVFRHIEPKGSDQCQLLVPSDGEGQAFEDFDIDYTQGIAYLAGDNRTWMQRFHVKDQSTQKHGSVYKFDIQSEKFRKLNLIDYPYEYFHPLGVNLLRGSNQHLFMTNFRVDSQGGTLGTVEIFAINPTNNNQIQWIDSVVHPLFTMPDDVLAIDEKTFYVTNVYHYRKDHSALMHSFELFAKRPWHNVLLCAKEKNWQCSIVADGIIMANGLAASLDFETIYVAASTEKRIRVYNRNPKDNSLTYQRSFDVPCFVDNVIVNDKGQLMAAGHPKVINYILHERNPRGHRAPSEAVIFLDPKSNSTYETLLLNNGEVLSASTVAGIYKNKLLVGGLYDHGLLLCPTAA